MLLPIFFPRHIRAAQLTERLEQATFHGHFCTFSSVFVKVGSLLRRWKKKKNKARTGEFGCRRKNHI